MTSLEVALCKDVLQEYYGDVVAAVGGYLVSQGRASLLNIAKNTSCKTDQVCFCCVALFIIVIIKLCN